VIDRSRRRRRVRRTHIYILSVLSLRRRRSSGSRRAAAAADGADRRDGPLARTRDAPRPLHARRLRRAERRGHGVTPRCSGTS
jgi:hypothetical protein